MRSNLDVQFGQKAKVLTNTTATLSILISIGSIDFFLGALDLGSPLAY